MPLCLILTDHGCIESNLRKSYCSHLFNWVPVLEKMSMALVATIELLSITCEQSSHDSGNRNHVSSKKKMGVIS